MHTFYCVFFTLRMEEIEEMGKVYKQNTMAYVARHVSLLYHQQELATKKN